MSLPQSTEYDEAIQNSRIAFIDPELRGSANDGPILMGVPGGPVASGNFAIVYRFRAGSRRLAVKCFTREKTDQQARYRLIHEYLATKKLPWTIDFTFIEQGIRVKGKTYPVVKMEWIENGRTLLAHINDAIKTGQPLDLLRDQFYRLAFDLKRHSIAHGDLQHANLIVTGGSLRLIDYDGMCVPATAGLPSEEDGLPDYQHPLRNGGKLHSALDHFSTLVIWTSLHALTIDPTLWSRWVGDNERLLFTKSDFNSPESSALIWELLSYQEPRITLVVDALVKATKAPTLEQVPHLVDIIKDGSECSATPWWQAAPPSGEIQVPELAGAAEPPLLPAWISSVDQEVLPPVHFRGRTVLLSIYSALTIGGVALLAVQASGQIGYIPSTVFPWLATVIVGYFAVIGVAFLHRPELAAKRTAASTLLAKQIQAQRAERALQSQLQPFKNVITGGEQRILESDRSIRMLEAKIREIDTRADEQLRLIKQRMSGQRESAATAERAAITKISSKRREIGVRYDAAIREIELEHNLALKLYHEKKDRLSFSAERDAKAKFSAKFGALIQAELAMVDIGRITVAGVSPADFRHYNFNTVADIKEYAYDGMFRHRNGGIFKIRGVGPVKGEQIEAIRQRLIYKVSQKIPKGQRDAIAQESENELKIARRELEASRAVANTKAETAKKQARLDYDKALEFIAVEETNARQCTRTTRSSTEREFAACKAKVDAEAAMEKSPIATELWALQSVANPARYLVSSTRAQMHSATRLASQNATKTRLEFEAAKNEAARYDAITFANFLLHIFS
jgi:hypothetical protein